MQKNTYYHTKILIFIMKLSKLLKTIKQILYRFDLFGQQIQLFVKQEPVHNTIMSSFISLIVLFLAGFSFSLMLIELFQQQSPFVLENIEFTPNPEVRVEFKYFQAINITSDKYMFSTAITDFNTIPIINLPNFTIYTVKAENCIRITQTGSDGKQSIQNDCFNYTLKSCDKVQMNQQLKQVMHLFTKLQKSLNATKMQLQLSYCIDDEEWNNRPILLQGLGNSLIFSRFTLQFRKCINGTGDYGIFFFILKLVCAPQDVIDQMLGIGYLGINFADAFIKQQQIGNPYQKINKLIAKGISGNAFSNLFIYMKHSQVNTQENFFYYFPSSQIYKELQFDRSDANTFPAIPGNDIFLMASFILDDNQVIFMRTYSNILNILGDIGGLYSLLFFLGSIIALPLSSLSLNMTLVNSLFNFKSRDIQNSKSSNEQLKIFKNGFSFSQDKKEAFPRSLSLKDLSQQIQKAGGNIASSDQYSQAKNMKEKLKLKYHQLQLVRWEKLTALFCGYKKRQIDYGVKKIEQKLDVINLIQKLNEIEKLKLLLLSDDQRRLFEFLPKPKIPIINSSRRPSIVNIEQQQQDAFTEWIFFQEEKDFLGKGIQALNAYTRIKSLSDNKIEINQRLINLLDDDLKQLFEMSQEDNKCNSKDNLISISKIKHKDSGVQFQDDISLQNVMCLE